MSVEQIFADQRGLITRHQAGAAGLRPGQIRYRVNHRRWHRVHRSVYRHAAVPVDWHQQALAAVLASEGVASHRTATVLWGLDMFSQPAIEVTHAHGRRAREVDGAIVHRSTQWSARQEALRMAIPCTGIERTIMDAAGTMSVDMTERLAEDAVRRRLTSFGALATYLCWHGKQGRTGCGNLRRMLLLRAPNASLPLSDFSRRVTQLLSRSGVATPVLEHKVYDSTGNFIMQADLAWPERRKIVELDGLAWHFGRADVERDRRKRARARSEGWRIHEVLWSMYAEDPAALAHQIANFLNS